MTSDPIKQWHQAPSVRGCSCMECRRRAICHDVPNLGIICKVCVVKARECSHEGCDGLATKSMGWECRPCFIGDDDVLCIDDFGGFKESALASASEMTSDAFRGASVFSAEVTRAAKKLGAHKPANWGWFPVAVKGGK